MYAAHFILRNIVDQCLEWNSPLFINYVDFRKAFDSINKESLWIIRKYYGIPSKSINLVKISYKNFKCAVEQIVKMVSCDVGSEARMCDVRVCVCIGDRLDYAENN